MSSLPKSWNTLVISLNNSTSDGKCTMDLITNSLISEEARREERGTHGHSNANIIKSWGRSNNQSKGNGQNAEKLRGQLKSHLRLICYYSTKPSHKKIKCRIFKTYINFRKSKGRSWWAKER